MEQRCLGPRGVAQSASLGYWVGENFARQGFMTEGLTAVLDFAFERLALHRIEAACLPDNEASQALLRKIGFKEEGYSRQYLLYVFGTERLNVCFWL